MVGSWTNETSSVHNFFFSTLVSTEKTVEFCRNCRFSLVYFLFFFLFIYLLFFFFLGGGGGGGEGGDDLLEFRY